MRKPAARTVVKRHVESGWLARTAPHSKLALGDCGGPVGPAAMHAAAWRPTPRARPLLRTRSKRSSSPRASALRTFRTFPSASMSTAARICRIWRSRNSKITPTMTPSINFVSAGPGTQTIVMRGVSDGSNPNYSERGRRPVSGRRHVDELLRHVRPTCICTTSSASKC